MLHTLTTNDMNENQYMIGCNTRTGWEGCNDENANAKIVGNDQLCGCQQSENFDKMKKAEKH